jgi:hypothetical protein
MAEALRTHCPGSGTAPDPHAGHDMLGMRTEGMDHRAPQKSESPAEEPQAY